MFLKLNGKKLKSIAFKVRKIYICTQMCPYSKDLYRRRFQYTRLLVSTRYSFTVLWLKKSIDALALIRGPPTPPTAVLAQRATERTMLGAWWQTKGHHSLEEKQIEVAVGHKTRRTDGCWGRKIGHAPENEAQDGWKDLIKFGGSHWVLHKMIALEIYGES